MSQLRPPILLLAPARDPVGTGRQIELFVAAAVARGFEVHLGVTAGSGSVPARLAAAGHPVHRLGARPVVDAAACAAAIRAVRRLRPAVVHAFGTAQLPVAAAVATVVPGIRAVASVTRLPTTPLRRWAAGRLAAVVVPTPALAAAWPRGPRVAVVPPGIAPAAVAGLSRHEVAARLGLDPGRHWTLCVAPLVARSRLERLIWAIDQLGVVRQDLQHVLVGSGPLRRRVVRRARAQAIAERIAVLPDCDCLPDLLAHTRLVWQSGDVAYGGALLDALAAGVPSVAVDCATSREIVADGVTGRLVPALPESEFPRRAFGILDDDDMARGQARAAVQRAAASFPAETALAAHLAAIEAAL